MKLIGPFKQIVTLANLPLRGKLSDDQLEIINNGGLLIKDGKIEIADSFQKLKEQFIIKGIEEMKKGNVSVFLIPVSTSTKLFHDYIKPNANEIRFLKGRVKFGKINDNGEFYYPLNKYGKVQSGTKDSMIVIFK